MSIPDSCTQATRAVRAAIATDREHGAVVPPIHLTSTFAFEGFDRPRTFDYTRSGNPTRSHLASALAELEGGARAVVTSTGMSAVALVLQLLQPGETIVAAHDCYGGTQRLLRALARKAHFNLVFADLTAEGAASEIARHAPRLVWIETPSNPLLRVTDVRGVAAAAHAAGATVVVDNTFLSPALQQPIALGADGVMIGRLQACALAVAGVLGVGHMIKLLREELEVTMALAGCATLADIAAAEVTGGRPC